MEKNECISQTKQFFIFSPLKSVIKRTIAPRKIALPPHKIFPENNCIAKIRLEERHGF